MNDFDIQREFERQMAEEHGVDVPEEVLKMYKLRKILSKALFMEGITDRDEAVDMLLWAVGEDVKNLHFSLWPERIRERTGISFDPRQASVLNIFRAVAKEWRRKHSGRAFIT